MAEKLKTNYLDHICIAVNDVKRAKRIISMPLAGK